MRDMHVVVLSFTQVTTMSYDRDIPTDLFPSEADDGYFWSKMNQIARSSETLHQLGASCSTIAGIVDGTLRLGKRGISQLDGADDEFDDGDEDASSAMSGLRLKPGGKKGGKKKVDVDAYCQAVRGATETFKEGHRATSTAVEHDMYMRLINCWAERNGFGTFVVPRDGAKDPPTV